jgi:hypothetical protein
MFAGNEMTMNWKSVALGNVCRIFKGKQIVGLLKLQNWRTEGYGELNGHLVRFVTTGGVCPVTRILDIEGKREWGTIHYNYRNLSARIRLEGQDFNWKFEKWDLTKWSINSELGVVVFLQEGWWDKQGAITCDEDERKILILCGLYVKSFIVRAIAG